MSLKEKFDKAGLTGTKVALPKGTVKDADGDKKEYKISKETQALIDALQTKDARVVKTPAGATKASAFASKREKRKTRYTAADKVAKHAGNTVAATNSNTLGALTKTESTLAKIIADATSKGKSPIAKKLSRVGSEIAADNTEIAKQDFAKSEAKISKAKEGLGTVGQAAVDLGFAGTQLATDAATNIVAPGLGLASMGLRSFGQGVQKAEDEGVTGGRAIAYGAGTAAIELGTEKIASVAKPLKAIYGSGAVDDVLGKLAKTGKGRKVLEVLGSAASEGAEEAVADVLQVPLQQAALQNGAKFDADFVANTAYDALLGGVLGGALGTAGAISSASRNRTEGTKKNNAQVIADAMNKARQKNAAPPVMQRAQAQTGSAENINPDAGVYGRSAEGRAQYPHINDYLDENVTLDMGAGTHISQRTAQSVADRRMQAFQFEHPEMRQYYQEAAEDLNADADLSLQMPAGVRKERTMQGNRYVHTTQASGAVRRAMDMGLTRDDIIRGTEDIINDQGAENNANAKRVELVLDDMLTEGYSTMFGKRTGPNAEYIKAKQDIPGYQAPEAGEELPIWDMAEDSQQRTRQVLRDVSAGATMNKNGGATYGGEGQVSGSAGSYERTERAVPQWGGTDGRGVSGRNGRINDAVRVGQMGRYRRAGEYGIQVKPVSDEYLAERGHKAGRGFSRDGVIYVSENIADQDIPEFINHELIHTMKQLDFEPYLQFTQSVESRLKMNRDTEFTLQNAMRHRGYSGTYDSLDLNSKFTVLDELNATLYGGYQVYPEFFEQNIGRIMDYPEGYISDLSDVLEQFRNRSANDGLGAAENAQQMGNSVGSAKSQYSVERKISQYRLNTLEKILTPEELENLRGTDFSYQVLHDNELLDKARERLVYQARGEDGRMHTYFDYEDEMYNLRTKDMWNAEDVATAGMIGAYLKDRAHESGDWSDFNNWEKHSQEHATELSRAMRTLYLYQSDEDMALSRATEILLKSDLSEDMQNSIQSEIYSKARAIAAAQDEQSLIDIIEDTAMRRGTTKRGVTGILFGKDKGLSRKVRKYLEQMDYDTLKAKALLSAENIAADYTKRSAGEKVKTIQVLHQLGNLITFERNFGGNTAFGLQDATADNVAAAMDMILARFTGTRSQEFNAYFASKGQRAAATRAMQNAVVDIALDIDEISETRYGLTSGRTFKMNRGPMSRFLSTAEKYLSYSLTASDEFFKGGARAGTEQGLTRLYEAGKLNIPSDQTGIEGMGNPDVDKFIREKAEEKARYVTFQDDSVGADIAQGGHDVLNRIVGFGRKTGHNGKPTHAFGLGDLLMPYAKVPGNLAVRAVEYSPVSLATGAKDIVGTLIAAKQGKLDINMQRKAVQEIGRGVTGTALWALFAAIARAGLIRNADDQNDEDVAALNAAEGISGTQWNLDATMRGLNGESTAWQKGDTLINISFLEPLNAAMAAGTMLNEDLEANATLKEMTLHSLDKVAESILEIPTMQTINDLYTDMSYGTGFLESVANAGLSSIASSVTPALLRQAAKAGDNNYRDVYSSDSMFDQARDKLKQNIPGLRETLPAKLDNFGREKTYTDDRVMNFVNAFVAPGSINKYKQSGLSKTLESLGDPKLYPQRNAPKDVSVDNEKIELTYSQRQKYQKSRGGTAFATMNAMTKTSAYQHASREDRIGMLSLCNEYANAVAKDEVVEQYDLPKRFTNAKESGNPAEFLAEAYIYGTNTAGGIDEKAKTAVEQYGMTVDQYADIRSKLNAIKADKDKYGESITGSRKPKVVAYLKTLDLTPEQYNYMYHTEYDK